MCLQRGSAARAGEQPHCAARDVVPTSTCPGRAAGTHARHVWAGDEQPPVLLADTERRFPCPPAPAEHPQGDRVTGLKPAKLSQPCGPFPSKYFCWDA